MRVSFEGLTESIPRWSVPSLSPVVEPVDGVYVAPGGEGAFIGPTIEIRDSRSFELGQVLLIAAPAAVGKTSMAEQLSLVTGNPIWDLGRLSPGSATFTGTLTQIYGAAGHDLVRDALRNGRACLILDAADEAIVRVGMSSFRAALADLRRLIGVDGNGLAVIMLGRPDTMEDCERELIDLSFQVARADVDFFSESQAREFVKAKAQKEKTPIIPDFEDFLGRFFSSVQRALGTDTWEDAKSFVGYAPVLDSLATFYRKESNPMRRIKDIERNASESHVWDLLIDIVEQVLDRETDKFARSFGGSSEAKVNFGKAVYSRELQVNMLAAYDPLSVQVDFPSEGDIDWLDDLTRQVQDQYRVHPFLVMQGDGNPLLQFANAAFRDYVVLDQLMLSQAAAESVAGYWNSVKVGASPILSKYLFAEKFRLRSLEPSGLGVVLDSHAVSFSTDTSLLVEEVLEDQDDVAMIQLTSIKDGVMGASSLSRPFPISQAIHLDRTLVRAEIDAPSLNMVLGSGRGDFTVGPAVSIRAHTLSTECLELRVRRDSRVPSVSVQATRLLGSLSRISSRPSELVVSVEGALRHPWQAFSVSVMGADSGDGESRYWAGMSIRRNVRWFVKESLAGALTYPVQAMDAILARGRASQTVWDWMIARGDVSRTGAAYRLSIPGLEIPRILKNDLEDQSFAAYVDDFLRWSDS